VKITQPDRARLRELIYTYAHARDRYTPLLEVDRALDALFDRLDELEENGLHDLRQLQRVQVRLAELKEKLATERTCAKALQARSERYERRILELEAENERLRDAVRDPWSPLRK